MRTQNPGHVLCKHYDNRGILKRPKRFHFAYECVAWLEHVEIKACHVRVVFKMGKRWPLFVYFRSFLTLQRQIMHKFDYKWYRHRWCAWELNLGRQYGKRRWIHWAMATPLKVVFFPITVVNMGTHWYRLGRSELKMTFKNTISIFTYL